MIDPAKLIIDVGRALAPYLYTAWRRRMGKTPENSLRLHDLIAIDNQDKLFAYKLERDLVALSEDLAESMLPILALDGANLKPQRSAMVAAIISDCLTQTDDLSFLYEVKLDPILVADHLLSRIDLSEYTLSEAELRLLKVCVEELANRLIAIADRLPIATSSFRKTVLNDVAALRILGTKILDEIVLFTERNRHQRSFLIDNFELRYRSSIRQSFGQIELFGLDIDGWTIKHDIDVSYVSLRVEGKPHSVPAREPVSVDEIHAEDVLARSSRVIIRGHAGSGKTTLLQWLAVQMADRQLPAKLVHLESMVPIVIRLRDYAGASLPVGRNLLACASPAAVAHAPEGWLEDLMQQGRVLFLVDGADEISTKAIGDVRRWIVDLMTHSPSSRVILTTRPSAVPPDFLNEFSFESYFLAPMSAYEIESFVTYWHEGLGKAAADRGTDIPHERKRSELMDTLRGQPTLRRMATSPLICAILCTLNLRNRLAAVSDRIDLYTVAFRLIAHERDSLKKMADSSYVKMSFPLKERLLGEIAYWITRTERTHCSKEDIVKTVERCVSVETLAELGVSAEELGRDVIWRSGLLKDVSLDAIEFLHKTFQEFLAAKAIVRASDENLVASKFALREWSELILMVASLTPQKNAVDLIRKLLERSELERDEFYGLLAASCLASVPDASDLKEAVTSRLARVIPPNDHGSAKLLGDAGELVVPLLQYSSAYSSFQNALIVEILSQVHTPESRRTLREYIKYGALNYSFLRAVLRAIEEDDEEGFEAEACELLISRNDPKVYWRTRHGIVRVLFREMGLFEPYLKGVRTVVFDGSCGMDLRGILHDGFLSYRAIREVWVCNFEQTVSLSKLDKYRMIDALYLVNAKGVESLQVLVDSDNIKRVILINSWVNDHDAIKYSDSLQEIRIAESKEEAQDIAELIASSRAVFWLDREMYDMVGEFLRWSSPPLVSEVGNEGRIRLWNERDVRRVLMSQQVVGAAERITGQAKGLTKDPIRPSPCRIGPPAF